MIFLLPILIVVALYLAWLPFHDPKSQLFGKSIYRVKTNKKFVALTFDDGPNPKATPQILDTLKEKGTKATFFLLGANSQKYPDLVKRIAKDGHEIAIHSYSHSPWLFISAPQSIRDDLQSSVETIAKITKSQARYFRPPWGNRSPWLSKEANKLGLTIINWSIDPWDAWLHPTKERILKRTAAQLHPGGIILLHDGHGLTTTYSKQATISALPELITQVESRGYTFVTISELLSGD